MAARGARLFSKMTVLKTGARERPKRERKTAMECFAGLDVAMEETAICVIAIFKVLKPYAAKRRRVGHEAGSLAPWLQVELKQRGLPAICVEGWHARAALSANAQQ
jgi:transposase